MANPTEIKISPERLKELLKEVEVELAKSLRTEGEALAKAGPLDEPDGDESPAASSAPASPPPGDAPPAPAAASTDGSPPAESPEPPGPGPEAQEPDGEGSPDAGAEPAGAPSEEELKQAFSELPDEELEVYYRAVKAAVFERMGGPGGQPDGSAQASSPPPASPSAAPAMKSDVTDVQPTKVGEGKDHLAPVQPTKVGAGEDKLADVQVTKAEREAADLRKKVAEYEARVAEYETNTATLAKAFRAIVERPERKAITSIVDVAPAARKVDVDGMSRSEIITRLSKAAQNPSLKKSDRETINQFCVGTADVSQIAHLLVE